MRKAVFMWDVTKKSKHGITVIGITNKIGQFKLKYKERGTFKGID